MQDSNHSTSPTAHTGLSCPRVGLYIDPDATSHELMDKAREWIRHADGVIGIIADLTVEVPHPDLAEFHQMAVALRAVYAMTNISTQFAQEAYEKRCEERLRARFDEPLA
jgi:hypothetical protein